MHTLFTGFCLASPTLTGDEDGLCSSHFGQLVECLFSYLIHVGRQSATSHGVFINDFIAVEREQLVRVDGDEDFAQPGVDAVAVEAVFDVVQDAGFVDFF